MSRKALILGIGGQDGSYLADHLLLHNYEVHGFHRRTSAGNLANVSHILHQITLHRGDLLDAASVERVVATVQPDELYNEADQDNVDWSFASPAYSVDVTVKGVVNVLEAVRKHSPGTKVFQPCSATVFGYASPPQNENTPLHPQSPYACGKAATYHFARYYRHSHNLWVATAFLYNHDSPRRSSEYLLHKVCKGVAELKKGLIDCLTVGSLNLKFDLGYAGDYVVALYEIMQMRDPCDWIVGTGVLTSVGQLVEEAFRQVGLKSKGQVRQDPTLLRPGNPPTLQADLSKLQRITGWKPTTTLQQLVGMVLKKYL